MSAVEEQVTGTGTTEIPTSGDVDEISEQTRKRLALTNRQKVAIFLSCLGHQKASIILREMPEEEAISLVTEMMSLPKFDSETTLEVMKEFLTRAGKNSITNDSGAETVRKMLEELVGSARAHEIMEQIEGHRAASPLPKLLLADPHQAVSLLSEQQPQVVAVILTYLPPGDASTLLGQLDPKFQIAVSKRIAQLTRVDPAAIRQATSLLVSRLKKSGGNSSTTVTGGPGTLAEILNHTDRNMQEKLLESIEKTDPQLADEIRAKLFTFDDVMKLDDRSLQQIFRKAEAKTLALVIKTPNLTEDVIGKIRSNLSERVLEMVDEEIEVMGTVRGSQISGAQAAIVGIAKQLDAEEVITIRQEDEVVA